VILANRFVFIDGRVKRGCVATTGFPFPFHGGISLNHRTTQDQAISAFFSGFAETWDSLYGQKRNLFRRTLDSVFRRDIYERYRRTFDCLGADLGGKSVLDIGCGSGVYCFEAARRSAARVVGLDAAENMVALARASSAALRLEDVCEFVCSSFPPERLVPALVKHFDYGIVMGVMDYVADAAGFLKAAQSLVTEALVLSFPGKHWLRAPLRRYRYRLLGRPAVFTYDEEEIRAACSAAGFGTIDVVRLGHSGICYIVTARP
jgi:2-polyprenyl-3-methyl-5-hydroxy-6-metoxy-1,4-benzoquinol methylase